MHTPFAALLDRVHALVTDPHSDLALALPIAGWLLGGGDDRGAAAVREACLQRGLAPERVLEHELVAATRALQDACGVELARSLAIIQGLCRLAHHWQAALDSAAWAGYATEGLTLDEAGLAWLLEWRDAYPNDPWDATTLPIIAAPAAACMPGAVPLPPLVVCKLQPLHGDRVAELSLEAAMQGAADAGTAPPAIRQRVNTASMPLEIPGPLNGRIRVQRSLLDDWTLLLEIDSPILVLSARMLALPLAPCSPHLWRAQPCTRLHQRWMAQPAPIRIDLDGGPRLELR